MPLDVLSLTQATFPDVGATICIPTLFPMASLQDSQLPGPTF